MKKLLLLLLLVFPNFAMVQDGEVPIYDFATLENNLVSVGPNIYASKFEVTNIDFRAFLGVLYRTNQVELYRKCGYDSTLWVRTFPGGFSQPMQDNYHWNNAFDEYPAVNISYEAATEFCKWITKGYNSWPERKYQGAIFRLPAKAEWLAGAAAKEETGLPWLSKEPFDEKNRCLANIKFPNEKNPEKPNYLKDGGFQTVHVKSCNANSLGLHNIIGNVSEMLQERGESIGGNWDSFLEECAVSKTQKLGNADPRLGFRLFMEVKSN